MLLRGSYFSSAHLSEWNRSSGQLIHISFFEDKDEDEDEDEDDEDKDDEGDDVDIKLFFLLKNRSLDFLHILQAISSYKSKRRYVFERKDPAQWRVVLNESLIFVFTIYRVFFLTGPLLNFLSVGR